MGLFATKGTTQVALGFSGWTVLFFLYLFGTSSVLYRFRVGNRQLSLVTIGLILILGMFVSACAIADFQNQIDAIIAQTN